MRCDTCGRECADGDRFCVDCGSPLARADAADDGSDVTLWTLQASVHRLSAEVAERFVCIVDDSKLVRRLGRFPLPIEVLPAARAHVAREMVRRNARPVLREGFRTDNGNPILDVHDLDMRAPADLECELNQIPGTLANGIFARRPADVLLVADGKGVTRF